jgi:hypothetical protein
MSFCYLRHYKLKITVFDLRGCTTLKIGKLSGHISSVTPLYTSRLHWILIPGLTTNALGTVKPMWRQREYSFTPADRVGTSLLDLGSVNAPPPLDHRDSGVGWSCGPIGLGRYARHALG